MSEPQILIEPVDYDGELIALPLAPVLPLPALEPAGADAETVGSHRRPLWFGITAIAISALAGLAVAVLAVAVLVHPAPARSSADAGVVTPAVPVNRAAAPTAAQRAVYTRDIKARALAYQAALGSASANDPCTSMTMGAAADALLRAPSHAGGCQAAVRTRDAALARGRVSGVTNVRFVPVVDVTHGYASTMGARATWRSDPARSVTFLRERGRWVVAD
jgi:hypothetical protein